MAQALRHLAFVVGTLVPQPLEDHVPAEGAFNHLPIETLRVAQDSLNIIAREGLARAVEQRLMLPLVGGEASRDEAKAVAGRLLDHHLILLASEVEDALGHHRRG